MKRATIRRAEYLSHQNKLAEAQLGERSARLDKQLITKSAAYEHERRQVAQELRDFAREKKRMIPRFESPPPTLMINSSLGVTRKHSVPWKLQPASRHLDVPSNSPGGGTFFRRPRSKSKSPIDLPNEIQTLEGENGDVNITSYDYLPHMKHSNESMSLIKENANKKSHLHVLKLHRSLSSSAADHLPPIAKTEQGKNHLRSLQQDDSQDRGKGELLSIEFDVPRRDQGIVPGQQQQGLPFRQLKIRERTSNVSEEPDRSSPLTTNHKLTKPKSKNNSNNTSDRTENKQNTTYKILKEKMSELAPKIHDCASPHRQRKYLESERFNTEEEHTDKQDSSQYHQVKNNQSKTNNPNCGVNLAANHNSQETLSEKKSPVPPVRYCPPNPDSFDQFEVDSDETGSKGVSIKYSQQSRHLCKISTGSQQGYFVLGQTPSKEILQKDVRKVSTDGASLINTAAAIYGKTRRVGTGMAPNLTNLFLDSSAYQSGESGDGNNGLALDSESVTVSSDTAPGRRLSHGVPMNAAGRSRERGSLALRGNRVRQEDPSTADLIQYYQDVPEAAAFAGISVEPLDLSELESCRYLRKYVPKSMREDDSSIETDS